MTRDKKYTIAKNHGEYCEGIYETRQQALQVWWSDVQAQFTPEEINEILKDEGLGKSPKLMKTSSLTLRLWRFIFNGRDY